MKKFFYTFLLTTVLTSPVLAQKVQWACKIEKTNDPNEDTYSPKQTLFIPDAYPSGGTDNGNTYCIGFTYEKSDPDNIPTIKLKVEYCTPSIAEQVVVVESYNPGTITKITIHEVNGTSTEVYKGTAGKIEETQRIFYAKFNRTTSPVKYVSIEFKPGNVPGVNCIDGIAITSDQKPVDLTIKMHPDIYIFSKPKRLGDEVNSSANDILPVISPNGKVLYFDRKDDPNNIKKSGSDDAHDDIYFSYKNTVGDWTTATNIGKPLNNWGHNFVNSISPDGNSMLLANTYKEDGEPDGSGASISKRKVGNKWSFPQKLEIEQFYNKNKYVSFFMANNNRILLMAIEDSNSYGEKDIYISKFYDGGWSKPMNIGSDINTPQDEYAPVLASDNKTMYFASKGHLGFGSYDIFVTKRLDSTWTKWSEPINLGPQINTSGGDMGFSMPASGKEVYTYSWHDKDYKGDIYVTTLGKVPSIITDPVYLIEGHVYNLNTNEPVQATVQYDVYSNGQVEGYATTDPDNYGYTVTLPAGQNYTLYAKAKGYFTIEEEISIPATTSYTELKKDLYLVPIKTGQKISLNSVRFEQNSTTLSTSSSNALNRAIQTLRTNLTVKVKIILSCTDTDLLSKRKEFLKNYFIEKGILDTRIELESNSGSEKIELLITAE